MPSSRLRSWIASIALTLVAAPVAFGGVYGLVHWGLAHRYPVGAPRPLLDLPILQTSGSLGIGLICWLVAWALHLYASRRRRMPLAHVIVPAVAFLTFAGLGFSAPPPVPPSEWKTP
ncbi:hypothetical protein [Caulobacter sp. 1776]|uniref:hypothetical protein n=1 Tax=Caulobacter sp. 1776 TaxID=3156420 RepID=UPI00339B2C21